MMFGWFPSLISLLSMIFFDLNENLVEQGTNDNPSSPKNMTDEIEVIVIDDEEGEVQILAKISLAASE